MKPPSVKSVRCAIYTRTADSQITISSGRWARDIAYAANAVANDDGDRRRAASCQIYHHHPLRLSIPLPDQNRAGTLDRTFAKEPGPAPSAPLPTFDPK